MALVKEGAVEWEMMNGSTELMNGNVDPTEPRSSFTTTTHTTITTTTTKDQHKLTNGVTEIINEHKNNSENTDSQQVELRNDVIEAISEESTGLDTCSESICSVSTKEVLNSESIITETSTSVISSTESKISSTECTQIISSTQNDSENTEENCIDNISNSENKISNNKSRKNDTPPKPIIEVKKNNPFDDIRMGLKSVKKTPKTITPKPAETESNELNELFKRSGSLKRNKTPLRTKETAKKDESELGSRRGSIKGKLPPKKLSDTSMKSEDEKDSKESDSKKGTLKGKL